MTKLLDQMAKGSVNQEKGEEQEENYYYYYDDDDQDYLDPAEEIKTKDSKKKAKANPSPMVWFPGQDGQDCPEVDGPSPDGKGGKNQRTIFWQS